MVRLPVASRQDPSAVYAYYDFTVTLLEIDPPIWRRFLLPQSASFLDLHVAIQEASGSWQGYHGFEFRKKASVVSPIIAGIPTDDDGFEDDAPPTPEAKKVKLRSYFGSKPGTVCIYNYDLGDDWLVSVKNAGVETVPHKFKRSLLGGARAFPHEDCGGTPGYGQCLAVLKMTRAKLAKDSDAAILLKWLGDWQPETFDLGAVKKKIDK